MENHEIRLTRLKQARKEIEDALVVQGHLEARLSRNVKELAQNAERDRARLEQIEKEKEAHRKMNEETDRRIEKLVSAIGTLISQAPPSTLPK